MSRQSEQQKQAVAKGLCRVCWKPRSRYRNECDDCARKRRERERNNPKYQAARKGGHGRKRMD